jgi:XTP/dITP diphosphohydrolase
MKKIVLASSNKGKIKEFSEMFNKLGIQIIPQSEFQVTDADETGLSFIENAILKARHCSTVTKLPSIADDSGLEVSTLDGQPGIYSAGYSGIHGNDKLNTQKLLDTLGSSTERDARFVCAVAYVKHTNDPTPIVTVGYLDGSITTEACGSRGFGYDPVFYVKEFGKTLAEISSEQKNSISHRSKALKKFLKQVP